ncbi:MAG: N(4)-(beta-N-acetylglucosaminyl)-L-asparaginase [Planctomycetota bacterium]
MASNIDKWTRRRFIQTGAALAGGAALRGAEPLIAQVKPLIQGPQVDRMLRIGNLPLVVASANGIKAIETAMRLMKDGKDPLDAVIAAVNIVEDDPNDQSVGLGGLPNEDGVVELDASVMHGPTHKAGAVASLRNIKNPSCVARMVMQRTDHVLLVGEGALRFARAHGFKEENLLTEKSREAWLKWKESMSSKDAWLEPVGETPQSRDRQGAGETPKGTGGKDAIPFTWGTINCLGINAKGDIGGVTTTSGLSWKVPGRVGDSPIIGAGLYVDNGVGAAGSTGRGEANLQNCSSFLIVELMRQGRSPGEACMEVMKRICDRTEKRLCDEKGEPNYSLILYAISKVGTFGGATMRAGAKMAVMDKDGARLVELPGLLPEKRKQE